MRCPRFTPALLALSAMAICVNSYPSAVATADEQTPDTLQQRVATLETQLRELQQLVAVLQAEQLRDTLPVQPSAIVGKWVATPDSDQTIALYFHPNGTLDITALGSLHGKGTWKLSKMQVLCSYRYDGKHALDTDLPLALVSKNAMAFAGVVYRRSNPAAIANADAK